MDTEENLKKGLNVLSHDGVKIYNTFNKKLQKFSNRHSEDIIKNRN